MREFIRAARPWAALVAVSVVLGACGDDDPSTPDFTEETAEQTADAAEAVFAPIEASAGVGANVGNVFGALIGLGFGSELAGVSPMVPFEMADQLRRAPFRMMRSPMTAPAAAASLAGILIPEAALGITFVWDPVDESYVPSDQTGAPEDGARFIYYAVDLVGRPTEPLNDLGHIDLVDASTASMARLEIEVVRDAGNLTLVDYFVQGAVTGNLQTTTVTLDAEGFVSDGSDPVDFDMQWIYSGNELETTSDVDILIENDAEDASLGLVFEAVDDEDSGTQEAEFTVAHGSNVAVFDVSGEYAYVGETYVGTVDGSLSFNGAEVVIFSGDEDDPDFTRPDGSNLTAVEVNALVRTWQMFWLTQAFAFEIMFPFLILMAFSGY